MYSLLHRTSSKYTGHSFPLTASLLSRVYNNPFVSERLIKVQIIRPVIFKNSYKDQLCTVPEAAYTKNGLFNLGEKMTRSSTTPSPLDEPETRNPRTGPEGRHSFLLDCPVHAPSTGALPLKKGQRRIKGPHSFNTDGYWTQVRLCIWASGH